MVKNNQEGYLDKIISFFREFESIKGYLPSINSAGYPFIVLFVVISLILSMISDFFGWVGFFVTTWCIYFFRDPDRILPDLSNILISPADGKVLSLSEVNSPENLIDKKVVKMKKISIFMNVFNVHVNRIPVSGKVSWLKYIPGAFFNASLEKSSEENERMIAKIAISKNLEIFVVQIAGLIARRIKCDLTENQSVKIGDRYGIIRFGSRVDVYVPTNFNVRVLEGQTVISGETVIADFNTKTKN